MNDNKIAPYEWNDIDVLYPQFLALKERSVGIEATVSGIQGGGILESSRSVSDSFPNIIRFL